jgi:phosphoribosylanthranilate isomerase
VAGEPTRIKFCGLTHPEDAHAAVESGAWAIGLIFYPRSPRRCRPEVGAAISAELRRRTEIVGVFVNPTLEELTRLADGVGLTMLQLHGEEGPAFCGEAARRTGCRVIKAARVRSGAEIQALAPFHTDFHLLDSYAPGRPGGTGETFAWELARRHRGRVPLILSGGLRPDNVAEAVRVVRPYAVDVASGVETRPGRKDHAALRAFAAAVREAEAQSGPVAPATPAPAAPSPAPAEQAGAR